MTWLPWQQRSMRTQLMVWNAWTLALLFALLGVVLHFSVWAILLNSIDRELEARTHGRGPGPQSEMLPRPPRPQAPDNSPPDDQPEGAPGPQIAEPGRIEPNGSEAGRGQPPPPDDAPNQMVEPRHRQFFQPRHIDRQGRVLAPPNATAPWDAAALAPALQGRPTYSTVVVDGEPVRILSLPVPSREHPDGVLQAPYPLTPVYTVVAGVDRALLFLLPIALCCAGLGGALLTKRALQPVAQFTQTAERIGAHDLSERLPVSGEDEFSNLACTFNQMLERLATAFAAQENLVRQLQELVEQQRRFTADASHELRTPLTAIRANASLCLSVPTSVDDYQQSMQEIDQAATVMSSLVSDLLLLARADASQLGRDRTLLNVHQIVEQAATAVTHSQVDSAPIHLTIPPTLHVYGNTAELVRLFTNLLDNATHYTPTEGCIRVSAGQANDMVQIRVTDSGVGIAPEHLSHIGERFYRVDASRYRQSGGTGLGLSICKGIVAAHGGTLTIASQVEQGTTVTVALPALSKMPH